MKTTGRVNGIISNIVIVKADGPVGQNEICYVWTGDTKMMAEVIKVIGDAAYVQVFDSTRGLKIGDRVEFEGHMLEVTLAPGLLSRNYDGLQNDLEKMDGLFIARGSITDPVDYDAEWEFSPLAKAGDKVTVEVLDVDLDRERISLSLKATQEDPWQRFARTHVPGQIVKGKVTKIVQFGVFISVEDGIEGLVHISELANRHVENPETVVKPGETVFVKVIDVDLDRRRISLSLKQANDSVDPASEDFDPAIYGMPAEYDEQGNYKYPEGFDPNANEWIAGYEKQREEWESQYAAAHELWEEHKEFVAKELENAAESAAADGQGPKEEKPVEETSNYSSAAPTTGTLADSDQLAALRDQLLGK